jgi:hypothetical protein
MTGEAAEHTFIFDEEGTCKLSWKFTIVDIEGEKIIDNLLIEEREQSEGCLGHSRTLSVLLRGRSVNSINTDELDEVYCNKWTSCGQILARCLGKIKEDGKT